MVGFQAFGFKIGFSFDFQGEDAVAIVNQEVNLSAAAVICPIIGFNFFQGLKLLQNILFCQSAFELFE